MTNEPNVHADDSISQTGHVNVTVKVPTESVDKVLHVVRQNSLICGFSFALSIVLCLLFVRYQLEYSNTQWQFNLLRSCLQSSQCDVQKVLKQLERK